MIVILFIAGTSFALFQYNCIKNSVNIEHIVNCRNAMVHGNNMNVDSSELFRIVKCDFKCDEPYVLIDQTCTGIKIEDGFVTSIVLGENGKVHKIGKIRVHATCPILHLKGILMMNMLCILYAVRRIRKYMFRFHSWICQTLQKIVMIRIVLSFQLVKQIMVKLMKPYTK